MRNNKLETTEWIMEVIMAWRRKGKRERETERISTYQVSLQGEMNKKYESIHLGVCSAVGTFDPVTPLKHTVYTLTS